MLADGDLTVDDRHELARKLIARGWSKSRVARTVGVSPQTIKRWISPEQWERDKAGARAYKRKHHDRLRAWDREYNERVRRAPCPGCNGTMASDSLLCRDCHDAITRVRRAVLIGTYLDGWPIRLIADVLDSNTNSLSSLLARMHATGELPHRYRVDEHGIRLPNAA